mgnify:CR=1 FL=1
MREARARLPGPLHSAAMKLRLEKPWLELTPERARAVPGHLGVYEVQSPAGETVRIGFAGARELFGLRSALAREASAQPPGSRFRYEVNAQYQSRWRELLMLYAREHGALPAGNERDRPARLGRMR